MKRKIYRMIIHILYTTKCPQCGKDVGYMDGFCDDCRKKLTAVKESVSIDGCEKVSAVCVYDENVKQAIYVLKNYCYNAAYAFALLMSEKLNKENETLPYDVIVPVPITKKKHKLRGYNQCELMAEELSAMTLIPKDFKSVVKSRETTDQKELSAKERQSNLNGAFEVRNKSALKGKNILVIDDISTTGATLREMCRCLHSAEVKSVSAIVCCKTEKMGEVKID